VIFAREYLRLDSASDSTPRQTRLRVRLDSASDSTPRAAVALWWNRDTPPRLSAAVRIVCGARSHLNETLPTASCARLEDLQVLAAEHATPPQRCRASVTGLYLPREVFFGRLVFAGALVPVCASDFGRFFPATSGSFG
jgi:hypothetical protein